MLKYSNKPTFIRGHRFDSRKEARRYEELLLLVRAGEISTVELQPVFKCGVKGKHICNYIADFRYLDRNCNTVIEGVKSPITRENPVYRLEKKLVEALHGVEIMEV